MIDRLRQDLRQASRALRQKPMFALVAIVCLAIGISVNTAAFSLLNAIVFREYPGVERQSELAGVFLGFKGEDGYTRIGRASLADWGVLRSGVPAFAGIAASGNVPFSLRVGGEPRAVRGSLVSTSYFDVLGTRPAAGRFFSAGDGDDVVVISHSLWSRAFDARPGVVGEPLVVGTRELSIIGIAPEGFFGLYPAEMIDPDFGSPDLYVPLAAEHSAAIDNRFLSVFGRLQPDASTAAAGAQLSGLATQLAASYPMQRRDAFVRVESGTGIAAENVELIAMILSAMVVPFLILLVACANLANQLAARGIQRRREFAVRLSLGASRSRVVAQLLIEAVLLALAASAAGVLLARWTLDAVRAWYLPTPFAIAIDARVVAFTIGLAMITAIAFGLLPALGATRPGLTDALKDGSGGGYRRSRVRNALVVVQIAASLAMVAVSSVFARVAATPPSPAMQELADRSLVVSVDLDLLGFDEAGGRAFQSSLMDRLTQLPGVASVGVAPFSMFELLPSTPVTMPGDERTRYLKVAEASGDWLDATNARVVRGRPFSTAEKTGPPTVAIVDEEIARYLWGDDEPIGRSLRIGADAEIASITVIGVIPTRRLLGFREPEGLIVIPGGSRYHARTNFYLRTSIDADAAVAAVRESVRALDPRVPILSVRTLEDAAAVEVAPLTGVSSGLAVLGFVSMALAALGLFGVLAFVVAERRYEIGVRMALGARRGDVVWMVVRQALGLGIAGVLSGTLLMIAVVTLLQAIIWGLEPLNPSVFAGVASMMLLVVLCAGAIPARRAASVDPAASLRAE